MPLVEKPIYIHEPTPLQCGQAALAMLTGIAVNDVISALGNERETSLKEMRSFLIEHDIMFVSERTPVFNKSELPRVALLSLETPRCWHWSIYFDGRFYDPEHGEADDFPVSNRRYYWELKNKV